jgi:hypothetical protein
MALIAEVMISRAEVKDWDCVGMIPSRGDLACMSTVKLSRAGVEDLDCIDKIESSRHQYQDLAHRDLQVI